MSDRNEIVSRVTAALEGKPAPVAIRNARKVDARGERRGYWVVSLSLIHISEPTRP